MIGRTIQLDGCEDEEFAEHSIRLMEAFDRGECILVVSSLTIQELTAAPTEVLRRLAAVPEANIETLQLDTQAKELAEAYLAQIEGMTLKEELKWLASQQIQDRFLKRLRDRAAQQADAADQPSASR